MPTLIVALVHDFVFVFCVIDSDETNRLKKASRRIDALTIMSSARVLTVPRNIPKAAKIPAIPAVAIPMARALVG